MKFVSTRDQYHTHSLRNVVLQGIAADGGLFVPEKVPILDESFITKLGNASYRTVSFELAKQILQEDIAEDDIRQVINSSLNFNIPIKKIERNIYILELFHGPTLAFKDIGARFLAHLTQLLIKDEKRKIIVLVATSGDTGSAIANAFSNLPRITVVVVYPKKRISNIQERQITSSGENVIAIGVEGVFDDCQKLILKMFRDTQITSRALLLSGNSMNIGRLLPQLFYFAYASSRLSAYSNDLIVSVPCGGYGNLTAGLITKKMGFLIKKFIAATNTNDTIVYYLQKGKVRRRPLVPTLSSSMDVAVPLNLERIKQIYQRDLQALRKDIVGSKCTDNETVSAMREIYEKYGYVIDPHGAVSYLGLRRYQKVHPHCTGVFLGTAHPAKFPKIVKYAINKIPQQPARLRHSLSKHVGNTHLSSKEYRKFKKILIRLLDL